MAEEAIGVSGLAGRYATALFDFAKERDEVDITEKDLVVLGTTLDGNRELKRLIRSPVIGREEQGRAMAAVAEPRESDDLMVGYFLLAELHDQLGDAVKAREYALRAQRLIQR